MFAKYFFLIFFSLAQNLDFSYYLRKANLTTTNHGFQIVKKNLGQTIAMMFKEGIKRTLKYKSPESSIEISLKKYFIFTGRYNLALLNCESPVFRLKN